MSQVRNKYALLSPKSDNDNCRIGILREEDFEGVIFTYGTVSLDEREEGVYLNFSYEIHDNPDNANTDSQEFRNLLGDILLDIVERNIEESPQDGDGSNNTFESTDE